MREGANVRSVLFSLDLAESVTTDQQVESLTEETQSIRLGRWTEALYVCKRAFGCTYGSTCRHAKPHRESVRCRERWRQVLGIHSSELNTVMSLYWSGVADITQVWNQMHRDTMRTDWDYNYRSRSGVYCSECIGIVGSRRFVPLKRARLVDTNVKVVCPSAIPSCVGRCSHAEAHHKNKFCKDLFPNTEARLQCRPVSQKHRTRSLLFDTPTLSCQR